MSSNGMRSGRLSRGSGSHSPPFPASVPRSHRYNPNTPPTTRPRHPFAGGYQARGQRQGRRPATNNSGGSTDMRRKTIRCQRIESEQRRDELRDGYRRLVSNQKSSKVSLLDRGKCRCLIDSVLLMMTLFLRSHPRQISRDDRTAAPDETPTNESEVQRLHTVSKRR
jgi:hypothetical protein